MGLQVSVLSDNATGAFCTLAGIIAVVFLTAKLTTKRTKLDAIPNVRSSTWLGSWWDAIAFMTNGSDIIQEGYEKYKAAPFKVAHMDRWQVVVSGRQFVEEMCKSPDDELSNLAAANENLKFEYLFPEVLHNPYHIPLIRSQLSRNLGVLYPKIKDEIVTAFEEILELKGNEWKSVPALDTIQNVICRATNRIFVGLPLCRNPDWVALNIQFTLDVVKGGIIIGLFPKIIAPLVARFMTKVPGSTRRGMKHLGPVVEKRQKYLDKYGNAWIDKHNDLLSGLIDGAVGPERSIKHLTLRVLGINFAAIHATANGGVQALYYLAANPQYMQPLRQEVESVVETEGWSRDSLAKMHKIDSFVKEVHRMEGIDSLSMMRKAMKDFTFSDGTAIPKGACVSIASRGIHLDNQFYENATMFDPFRFSDMRDEDGEDVKHQFASPNPEYLTFGHGRHAWSELSSFYYLPSQAFFCSPGRFFAAHELKTMLAHVVVSYDIKLEGSATRPQSLRVGTANVANPSAKVMFRKRAH
ncbi:cytochrome P450 [Melanogaster broomeanus]|nr:cytochrome P450 [Melanogaster broomeanus]